MPPIVRGERELVTDHSLHIRALFLRTLESRPPYAQQEVFGALRRLRHVVLEDVMRV